MIGNGIGSDQCMPRPPISLRRTCMAMNLEICVPLYEGRNNRFLFLERVNQKVLSKTNDPEKRRRIMKNDFQTCCFNNYLELGQNK